MLQAKSFQSVLTWLIFVSVLSVTCVLSADIQENDIIETPPNDLEETPPDIVPQLAVPLEAGISELIDLPDAVPVWDLLPLQNISAPSRTLGLYQDPTEYPGENCKRICRPKDRRICYYKFVLEHYQAMGVACGNCARGVLSDCEHPQCILGDGVEKGVMSINRKVPGPDIQVCKDDQIVVDVVNQAHGTAASLHWHGMHMRETPYMDGVPFVTQCPIPFSTTFRYEFRAAEAGTQFYHSHSGMHKVNGQYGALIVREPLASVSNGHLYDFDLPQHYILIADWTHSYGETLMPGLPSRGGINPEAITINGRGSFINWKTRERSSVPPTRYYVQPGKRYRFRIISSGSHACPIQIQIEKHNLMVIASDSFNVKPVVYDTLVTNSGERYDIVLHANHTEGDFWIRVRGLGLCAAFPTDAVALLRYVNNGIVTKEDVDKELPRMPEYNETFIDGRLLNHPHATCSGDDGQDCVTQLQAEQQDNNLLIAKPDYRFHLAFTNYVVPNKEIFQPDTYIAYGNSVGNTTLVGTINNISLIFPPSPPLSQPRDIDEASFCDDENRPAHCAGKQICHCVHRLLIRRNSIVELVLVDETATRGHMHHPFHLHGHAFMVTNMGQHQDGTPMTVRLMRAMEMQRSVPLSPYNPQPPFKDTVSIPSRGFAFVRFRANNPGFWLMHCHYEWHIAIGMGLVVQVDRPSKMVKAPLRFPQCGNYLPRVKRPR